MKPKLAWNQVSGMDWHAFLGRLKLHIGLWLPEKYVVGKIFGYGLQHQPWYPSLEEAQCAAEAEGEALLREAIVALEKTRELSEAPIPSPSGICTYCNAPRSQCDPFTCREH